MSNFGQGILQESLIDENINITLSEYRLCENNADKKSAISSERGATPKYESIKLTYYVDLKQAYLINVMKDYSSQLTKTKFLIGTQSHICQPRSSGPKFQIPGY